MLSVLSRAVDFVLGSLFEQKDHEQKQETDNGTFGDDLGPSDNDFIRYQDQHDVLLTSLVDQTEKNAESRSAQFTGKISQLFCGHGLIDGVVYFSDDKLHKNSYSKPLQIGDTVSVFAKQQFKEGGWIAESVTVVESLWKDEKEAPVIPTGEVGKVTQFREGHGTINRNISFDLSVCHDGYHPYVGDWVSVGLDVNANDDDDKSSDSDKFDSYTEDNVLCATKVIPLREWNFEGMISAAMPDHGYIEEEVYFRPDVCLRGYRPQKWDVVKVEAIESDQGKCRWRALSVMPTSDSSAFKARSKSGQKFAGRGRGFLVAGEKSRRPGRKHIMSIPNRLPQYPLPANLRQWVIDQYELTQCASCLTQRLCMNNYVEMMSTLLHLEEIQMELDIQEFSLHRECLQSVGQYLRLEVPGLAEGRPSVLIGDAVILSCPADPDQPQYEGIVHEIHSDAVMLKFNPNFHSCYNGEDYNVEFTFNRTSMRRCHQAVHLAATRLGEAVLFPKEVKLKSAQVDLTAIAGQQSGRVNHNARSRHLPQSITTGDHRDYVSNINHGIQDAISFYNPLLNDAQKAAVIQILLGRGRALPYIIFGPPGTGKTITMVEAILQVLTHIRGSRIIVCTPSNSAADLLAERIHDSHAVKMSDMVRLNAFNRSVDSIAERILAYCSTGEKLDVLCRYRIVISTCNTAGLLYTADLKAGHFTHAFVDEAGQATEPECLIPAGLVTGADGQLILAGDPRQLGPVLMSPYAKMYGLELSFLERLMEFVPYQHNSQLYAEHGGFQPHLITMLVQNYRSHSSILSLPSELFYYGKLQEHGAHSLTHTLVDWYLLPRSGWPLIFHGIRGEDIRELDSPSWFNPGETIQVVKYLQGLLGNKPPLAPEDIGIITPYRKQVEKIRMMTERLGIPRVKIGSVEEFQGQERKAIIISTVRSNELLLGSDIRHVLGFLSNPKRFNVAITRAQALLVVIGNPHILVKDEYWQKFVMMCIKQGCYTGCELPESLKTVQSEEKIVQPETDHPVNTTVA